MDTKEESGINAPDVRLFNTPLEIGIRCLIILNEIGIGSDTDTDRLMYFDYLTLNTRDLGGPESLHAPIPNRGVQVYARKEILQKALKLLISKELIGFVASSDGFRYAINSNGAKFLEYFSSKYYNELVHRAKWVVSHFNHDPTHKLQQFIDQNLQKWGGDFLSNDRMTTNI